MEMSCPPVRLDAGNHHDPGSGRCLTAHVSELAPVARCARTVLAHDPENAVAVRRLRRARRARRTRRVAVPPGLAGRLPRSADRDRTLIALLDEVLAETTGTPELAACDPARSHLEGVA